VIVTVAADVGIKDYVAMARLIAIAALLLFPAAASFQAAGITSLERQRLIAHLEITAAWLADEVAGLTRRQLAFRPSPESWNIAQVLDHLVVVGPIYWNDLQVSLKSTAGIPSISSDADILWYGIDRTRREEAIPTELPEGESRDLKAALAAYRKTHVQLLQYVKTTEDDLRSHYVARQGCDAYQWALLISTHEQRHILQIRELNAHPRFPRK
jgi:hypothetical protein